MESHTQREKHDQSNHELENTTTSKKHRKWHRFCVINMVLGRKKKHNKCRKGRMEINFQIEKLFFTHIHTHVI